MFLDMLLYRVNIWKLSAFCPLEVDYTENVGTMNAWLELLVREL